MISCFFKSFALIENKIMEYDLKLALEYEKGNEKEK